jgi:hypothetical protein
MSEAFALMCAMAVVIVAGALVLALAVITVAVIVKAVWYVIEVFFNE